MQLRDVKDIPDDGRSILIRVKGDCGLKHVWCEFGEFVDEHYSYYQTVYHKEDIIGWIPMPYVPCLKKKEIKF